MSIQNRSDQKLGILAMAATAFLWSIAGLFIKAVDWHPVTIAGMRSLIASVVIAVWLRRVRIRVSFPVVAAALANAATMLLFVSANKTTTAANAILLQYFAPALTAFIGAALLRERVRVEQYIALPLVVGGLVVMLYSDLDGGYLFGNILALLSALTFSFYFVFLRMQKEAAPIDSMLLSHWLTVAICAVASLWLPLPEVTPKAVAAILVLGVVQIGFSAILLSVAIKRISAAQATLIAVIEPVFNPVWVFLALGERPGINTIVGGAVVIAAVTAASIASAQRSGAKAAGNDPSGTPMNPRLG
jgi:drug/metabolite transporter (DMT)-like permease